MPSAPSKTIRTAAALLAVSVATPALAQDGEKAVAKETAGAAVEWGPCPAFMPDGCGIAILHGDPAEENTDILFRLPGGATADRHWHHSAERMVLLTGEMDVDYDDQDPVTLERGMYGYGPPMLPHSATCRSSEPCVLFIAFEEPVDAFAGAPD